MVLISDTFHVERVFPISQNQARAGIRQAGVLATSGGRVSFTSWISFDLEEGGTYWLEGVLRDRPYRDRQQVRLDRGTRVERRAARQTATQLGGPRNLTPHPPSSFQPQLP